METCIMKHIALFLKCLTVLFFVLTLQTTFAAERLNKDKWPKEIVKAVHDFLPECTISFIDYEVKPEGQPDPRYGQKYYEIGVMLKDSSKREVNVSPSGKILSVVTNAMPFDGISAKAQNTITEMSEVKGLFRVEMVGGETTYGFKLNGQFYRINSEGEVIIPNIAQQPNKEGKPVEWKLVWEDQFGKDGLPDSTIWSYEVGKIRNKEIQYYTKERLENARVENGMLIIEARKDNYEGNEVTSASIHTYGKKSILYQKVEVRAKLPEGRGTWPAIWMLGENRKTGVGWPSCGEIDIMENVGFDLDKIHFNIHTKAYNHAIKTNKGKIVPNINPSQDFHVYAIEWYTDKIDFFIDGKKYFTFLKEEGTDKWPFDKNQYLILNLAIGGAWGGMQGIDDTKYPFKYYIDYVKVYSQKK